MKHVGKSPEPPALLAFRLSNPDDTWDQFKDPLGSDLSDFRQVPWADQRGLCAYCEGVLSNAPAKASIEHFHPKSKSDCLVGGQDNWHLRWSNLLGSCLGGGSHPDASCDRKKGGVELCEKILNPLLLPTARCFDVNPLTGEMYVSHDCPPALRACADRTLEVLGLRCKRLNHERRKVLRSVIEQIRRRTDELCHAGTSTENADAQVARELALARFPSEGQLVPHFTSSRSLLGPAAENALAARLVW